MPSGKNNWSKHAAPFVRRAMRTAMKQARATWRGSKEPTPAQKRSIKSLQKKRLDINARIKKMKGK